MGIECPTCGNEYKKIGLHYGQSSCDYPEFSHPQDQIITGMMLGDGWINHHDDSGNPFFVVGMVNYEFLKWFDKMMKPHTTGVKNATGSDISKQDYYKVRTTRTPKLEKYLDWYPDGVHELQEVDPTPLLLKMWYVSDGHLACKDRDNPYAMFSTHKDKNREKMKESIFGTIQIPPSRDDGEDIAFGVQESKRLFRYMGEAPPGFDHKWPSENHYGGEFA